MSQGRNLLDVIDCGFRSGSLGEQIERSFIAGRPRRKSDVHVGTAIGIALDATLQTENPQDGSGEPQIVPDGCGDVARIERPQRLARQSVFPLGPMLPAKQPRLQRMDVFHRDHVDEGHER